MTVPAGFDYRVREKLLANRTYYVATTGADTNDGLSVGAEFLTIQAAVDAASMLDANSYDITIQVADGTYTGAVTLKNVVGAAVAGDLVIQGNNSTPGNVIISTTSAACFTANGLYSIWDIKDLKVQTTTSGSCFSVPFTSYIRLYNLEFGASAAAHISVSNGGVVFMGSNYSISGGGTYHYFTQGGRIIASGRTITVTTNVTFSTYIAYASMLGFITNESATYSLGAYTVTGTKYYVAVNSGIISCATQPGTGGTAATGGQYV